MARDQKISVAALNIRIHTDAKRDYNALLTKIASLRRGVRTYGTSHVALSNYNSEQQIGILSQYTEIDLDGEWFDLNDFDAASPEELTKISIPTSLKPNLYRFYLQLNADIHVVAFGTYQDARSLSARSVEKYFRAAVEWDEVKAQFGPIDVDVIQSYDEIDRILAHSELRELRLVIRPPNPDDIDDDLAKVIEMRLKDQNADVYEEVLKASGSHRLRPDDRTKKLAYVAAENGEVHAKGVADGVQTALTTNEKPQTETGTYTAESSTLTAFKRFADQLFRRVQNVRAKD